MYKGLEDKNAKLNSTVLDLRKKLANHQTVTADYEEKLKRFQEQYNDVKAQNQ